MSNLINFRKNAVKARSLDELIGLCKGVIADEKVCQKEAEFVLNWLEANMHVAEEFPASVLYPRLVEMLADNHLDDDESAELLEMLKQMTGEQGQAGAIPMSCTIAFDDPLPDIGFEGVEFCLTGEFAYGRRADVVKRIEELGGIIAKTVVKRGCVLVVGCMGSDAWLHSTHGTKLRDAVKFREEGYGIIIIPEYHWNDFATRAEAGESVKMDMPAPLAHLQTRAKRDAVTAFFSIEFGES